MARSVNLVILIGNLTRDPELRYTANGRAVCDIGLATNRAWKTEAGERKEETEFHRIVVWGKLAETCGQYLKKGRKAYFRGRIATRSYTAKDGTQKYATEVIADDMIMLSSGREGNETTQAESPEVSQQETTPVSTQEEPPVTPEEIPF